MPRPEKTSWELTPEAAMGSNEPLGDIFGLGKKKPPAPWNSKDPILVNHKDPRATLRKITVEFPADRYDMVAPRKVVLEAKDPEDTSINRMDLLREMIRTAYQQKKWKAREIKHLDLALERTPPQPGAPWLYERIGDHLLEQGLEIDYDLSTQDSVYLVMITGV